MGEDKTQPQRKKQRAAALCSSVKLLSPRKYPRLHLFFPVLFLGSPVVHAVTLLFLVSCVFWLKINAIKTVALALIVDMLNNPRRSRS